MYISHPTKPNEQVREPLGYVIASYSTLAILLVGWLFVELVVWTFQKATA